MKTVVWNITTRCNQACKYCFGPLCGGKELSTNKAKEKIKEFVKEGIEKLVITGGEPLLRYDIVDLIRLAKSKGLYTILHTNGLLVTRSFINQVEKYLDQINLPLDSFNEETNDKLRTKGHYRKVMLVLEMLKNGGIKIIISTVVTKINKYFIPRIGDVLPEYISRWRIFQFNPIGKAKKVEKMYTISDNEFAEVSDSVNKRDYLFEVQVVKRLDEEFHKSYSIVDQ